MTNFSVTIDGKEYPLATTLRVAYIIQGQNNHKPYTEVFQGIDKMPVENQVDMIYAAFKCANPVIAAEMSCNKFRDYFLDHMNLKDLMDLLQGLVEGIMGKSSESETTENIAEVSEKGN